MLAPSLRVNSERRTKPIVESLTHRFAAIVMCGLFAQTAGCSGEAQIGFSPLRSATSIVVNNARGAFRPETVRDPRTIARLIDLMNSNRHSWSARPRFALGSAPTCAYGIGFLRQAKVARGHIDRVERHDGLTIASRTRRRDRLQVEFQNGAARCSESSTRRYKPISLPSHPRSASRRNAASYQCGTPSQGTG
jgi:hypothetical protein